ncbi:hypothetical protein C7445_10398 [Alicyclobacillus sacchari]|uniref:Uncharacterized protein n=1 Tax=Alicyclobacillus sacchari TaxID=392010 RepID=A0A4R8LRD1_9BACL|nr:hypothetical protein C7445_10398 [Alicyclobacillus sacchari]
MMLLFTTMRLLLAWRFAGCETWISIYYHDLKNLMARACRQGGAGVCQFSPW